MNRTLVLAVGIVGLIASGWIPIGNGFKGTVRDIDGSPVVGAWVEARQVTHAALNPADFEGEPAQSMRTGGDGAWSLQGLGAGTWIVTAVGSVAPRTDEEMKDLARAGAKGTTPSGVAVTRLVHHYDDESSRVEVLDLGLAPTAERSFRGRLSGAFDPEHFGYQIQFTRAKVVHSPPGNHTVSGSVTITGNGKVSSSGDLATPIHFSAVPTADGQFDFGQFAVDESESISVKAYPLASGDHSLPNDAFRSPISKLVQGEYGVDVPLLASRTVTIRAACLPADSKGERLQVTVWDEQGARKAYSGTDPMTKQLMLPLGQYLARATVSNQASSIVLFRVEAIGELPNVALELLPASSEVTLMDEAGQPIKDAWIFVGTEAIAEFIDPFPLFSVTNDAGQLANIRLPAGKYRAQLIHEKGSYDEWRVNFDIDVKDSQTVVTVPLSKKIKTYP